MSIRMVRSHLPRQYKYSFNIFFLIINLRFNNSGATCSPACPIHAYCTATDDCACVQGYTGATCSTPNQWVLPAGNTIDQYTLAVGNTSKFYFHPKNTIIIAIYDSSYQGNYDLFINSAVTANPQPDGALRLMENACCHTSAITSKLV